MAINITADPGVITITGKMAILSHTPPAGRNPELDQIIDLDYSYETHNDDGSITETYPYVPLITITACGTWFNVTITADPAIITLSAIGYDKMGEVWRSDNSATGDVATITIEMATAIMLTELNKKNWVKWSNIGSIDFTIWKDNIAGERPLDWRGWIYAVKKLGNKIVAYGQNGVSLLAPVNNFWGLTTVSRIGLKAPGAVCGDAFTHFYIDKAGRLCKLGEQIEILGYEEFLDSMAPSIVMSYDELNQLIYICDGEIGYVYSVRDKSFGRGPSNVTSVGTLNGDLYIGAASTITIDPLEICTDIYDMGNRRNKTIASIEVGTDVAQTMYGAIDYRLDKAVAFATTPWVRVNPNGITNLPCFGVEFRFRLKTLVYEQFEIDYIRVSGVQHLSSYIDVFAREGR